MALVSLLVSFGGSAWFLFDPLRLAAEIHGFKRHFMR